MIPSQPLSPIRATPALGTAHAYDADADADADAEDRASVQWHPWHAAAGDTLRQVPGPQAQLRRGRITPGQTLARSVKVALHSAARELGVQLVGQGTQGVVRALPIGQTGCDGASRWAAPGVAAVVMVGAGLYFGGRTVRALAQGALVPATRTAHHLLVALPVAVDIGAVTAAALGSGMGGGARLLAGIAARMTGQVAGAVVAQAQSGLWGGLRLVTPHGERVANDSEPLRLVMATCLYALGYVCFLVLLTPALAGAASVTMLEVLHAFLEVIVQAVAALQAGLAFAYEPGQADAIAANMRDWRGTWERVRDYAGVRVWLGSFASDLPAALAGASLVAARGRVLMAARGWILQQPGQAAALSQERQWQQLEAGIEAASGQLAEAWQAGDGPDTVRIRLPAAPAQPAFDLVFGRDDGQLAFVPVP